VRICDPESGKVLRAGDQGEIRFRGWVMMDGYYQQGGSLRLDVDEDGFFRTGDYGYMDEAGRVYYRGRYAMMIKTGGENVSQIEVENFLMSEILEIRQAAVVGIPDDQWGELVVAFVETNDGNEIETEQLRERCKGRLAGYKIPRFVITVAESDWPLTPTGKIVKSDLADRAVATRRQDQIRSA
jgi:acyl-CoA synthetase (AMP-forming)/AMP-acid ligase II